MADRSKELIDSLKKSYEHTKELARMQQNATKVNQELAKAIQEQSKLAQFNLKASELLSINLGGLTTTFDTFTGVSKSFDKFMESNKGAVDTTLAGIHPLITEVRQTALAIPENITQFTDLTAAHIDRIGSNLIIVAQKSLGAAEANAAASRDLIPVVTATATRMALFESGLEKNSAGLGRFLARADLLGQNMQAMAGQFRSMSNALDLNNAQQTLFAQSVENSAKTYKSSSESILAALERFSSTMAVANAKNNVETSKLFTQIQAMTDRIAPEALSTALAPLFSQGVESLAVAGRLGVRDQLQRIQSGGGSVEDFQQIVEAFSNLKDQFMTGASYESDVIGAQILEQLSTLTAEQVNMLQVANKSIEEAKGNTQQIAKLSDATSTLNAIMKHVDDAITELKNKGLMFLQALADKFGPETLAKIGLIAAAIGTVVTVIGTIGAILGPFLAVMTPLFLALKTLLVTLVPLIISFLPLIIMVGILYKLVSGVFSGLNWLLSWVGLDLGSLIMDGFKMVLDWVMWGLGKAFDFIIWALSQIPLLGDVIVFVKDSIGSISEFVTGALTPVPGGGPGANPGQQTAGNTAELAEQARRAKAKDLKDFVNAYTSNHAMILNDLIKESLREDIRGDLSAESAQEARTRLNMLMESTLTELTVQNEFLLSGRFREYGGGKSGAGRR